jgi:hypothetical protein
MKNKLAVLFLAFLVIGAMANWSVAKLSWTGNNLLNQKYEVQLVEKQTQPADQIPSSPIPIPEGVSLSPTPSARLDNPPAEIAVTFPFVPKSGGLTVQLDETVLVTPDADLIIRDKSFVYPLPASASSGIYSTEYDGCPDTSLENCLSGTFSFVVK